MTDLDYRFDPETGEIFDTPFEGCDYNRYPIFKADTKENVEWVLQKLLDYDTHIEALKLRRKAINDNLDKIELEIVSSKKTLLEKFELELQEYAAEQLKDSKKKSLQLDYGKIGFRETKGSTTVINADLAIGWLENNNMADAVKIAKSVLVSKIPENTELPADIFEVKQPYTKFYIDTGIK